METTITKRQPAFWDDLLLRMTETVAAILKDGTGIISQAQKAILVCKDYLGSLEEAIIKYAFPDQSEEVFFFKQVKPKFYSQLIFYHKLFNLEIARPVGNPGDQKAYLQKELDRIKEFFDDNKFFYQYFRSGETFLDEKLFLRHQSDTVLSLQIDDIQSNPAFTTNYDYIISRIMANELLLTYLENAILLLNGKTINEKKELSAQEKSLTWTDAKSALIELIYAFKAKGSFNQGKATLKEISDYLQSVFNIEITNPSRDFQEILRRKAGYTIYLDGLKTSYLKYIDTIESKQ